MKALGFITTFLVLSSCFGQKPENQHCGSVREVSGLYIVRYEKGEIENAYRNQVLENEGKSFETQIDFSTLSYFIPNTKLDSNITAEIVGWDPFNRGEAVLFPVNLRIKEYLEKFCPKMIDSVKLFDHSRLSDGPYYKLSFDEDHLYKLYFIQGKELMMKLENTELNRMRLDLSDEISNSIDSFDVRFIYCMDPFSNSTIIPGLKTWNENE